ncbi:Sulfate permease CysP [Aliarcobacter thereius]|uniref:Phosphate transporter n=2 Tax=Aliarcobacter thereius TaxID=544718 RepID=A0A1C0BA31_9BACT|nr:inorganic phosphate transporter [Aliarcobacter thereius]OCL88421.1 Sulfate permease CysP [Aliarcobacter thereius]OCL91911.1 Sulfate permease CysP [Aliarcobacter thereius]OCL94991.1 Sulfate permease CysP [Aliarcobacter thereius LMG 24486]OCM00439.1 Sulfate permease CysP [Aliarcobacter thereius]QBF15138.1 inorganic phosphate transporter, PitA family [Aliarcobacter thereius LMG 24486]
MDMKTIKTIETATEKSLSSFAKLSFSLLFLLAVFLWTYSSHGKVPDNTFLIIGAIFGAYMALNIGANDVANNVGPAVGAKALTLTGAIIIAAIFESAGAIIAGGDVVNTIKSGIIDINLIENKDSFIWAMTAGLLAGAVWLNFATSIGAPVSTTHAIVGGVIGAGIASVGIAILNWGSLAEIASSWVISPLLGGIVAASFLYFIKKQIVYKENMLESAHKIVPILIAIMTWAFTTYLLLKGLRQLIHVSFFTASLISIPFAIASFFLIKKHIESKLSSLTNDRVSVNTLFTPALIFAAALLSFAHGANDVSNAIGPLAAINDAILHEGTSVKAHVPLWIMFVGAIGIVIGLVLYGPRLIKTVGSEITELDQMRAFSIAMATAVTVILASQLGLPVSSTHIAIGGVFGVGFLREALDMTEKNFVQDIREKFKKHKKELEKAQEDLFKLEAVKEKNKSTYIKIVDLFKRIDEIEAKVKQEKKDFKQAKGAKYVKRDAVKKIIAAWLITVPASALLAAGIYYMIKGIVAV